MADVDTVAKQFTQFYYSTFDSNRADLRPVYRDDSMLYWEGQAVQGGTSITNKLVTLPFEKVMHKVNTFEAQPTAPNAASLVVLVTGLLTVDDNLNPLQFSQLFNLIRDDEGNYYVLNDIFRLIYS